MPPRKRGVPGTSSGGSAHASLTFTEWADDGHVGAIDPIYTWTLAGFNSVEGSEAPYLLAGTQGADVVSYGADYSAGFVPVLDEDGFIPPGSIGCRIIPFLLGATAYPVVPTQYAEDDEILVNGYSVSSSIYYNASTAVYGRIALMLAAKPTSSVTLYLQVSTDNGGSWSYATSGIELSSLTNGAMYYGALEELTGYFQRGNYPIKLRLITYTGESSGTAFTIVRAWLELQ